MSSDENTLPIAVIIIPIDRPNRNFSVVVSDFQLVASVLVIWSNVAATKGVSAFIERAETKPRQATRYDHTLTRTFKGFGADPSI